MLRSSTRPLDHDVCGVTIRLGSVVERRVGRQRLVAERVQHRAAQGPSSQGPHEGALVDEAGRGRR